MNVFLCFFFSHAKHFLTFLKVENRDKDDSGGENDADIKPTPFELCQRGEHDDIYFEEQTGMRCRLCGAVILESRFVISKLVSSSKS